MLFWLFCTVEESELWSNKVVSLVPVGGVCCVLPSAWKMIEEPTIGLFICGCGEETSNITKGVFTMVFCGLLVAEVFCDVLGVV